MDATQGLSPRVELPNIPAGPGVCIIEDEHGHALQVVESKNIRRRIGNLLDSDGITAVHGPKIYGAQQRGERIYIRWKLTTHSKDEKARLIDELNPPWRETG